MLERTVVFVDTSYLLASFYNSWEIGARAQLEIDLPEVVATLGNMITQQLNQPVHRQFWYDGIPDSGPHRYQRALRACAGVQLRTGQLIEWGERRTQKGVDTRLVADLVLNATRGQFSDFVLVSGDADMIPGVQEAADMGIRVHLYGFGWDSMSSALRHACDTTTIIDPREDFSDAMQLQVLEGPLPPTIRERPLSDAEPVDQDQGPTAVPGYGPEPLRAPDDDSDEANPRSASHDDDDDGGTGFQQLDGLEHLKVFGARAAAQQAERAEASRGEAAGEAGREAGREAGPVKPAAGGAAGDQAAGDQAAGGADASAKHDPECAECETDSHEVRDIPTPSPAMVAEAARRQAQAPAQGPVTGTVRSDQRTHSPAAPELDEPSEAQVEANNESNQPGNQQLSNPEAADVPKPGPKPTPKPSMMAPRRKLRSRYVPLPEEVWSSAGFQTPYDVGQQYAAWWYENAASSEQRDKAHMLSGGGLPPEIDRPLLQFACETLHEYTLSEAQRVNLRDGFHSGIRGVLINIHRG
ncbi:NYN domain-containing protein [Corynebacterium sp. TA-R-1]|uniref:NYN domain-containing protein n=1 Tax=Corynebacterium stercoris TaxID=2943490 RepID=A0ABT1G3S8_9CORY|nr:NYN domain-containing protein [Corynebacterium stercoris]MCP1388688.1 NYN domain-containing protein [Corynebacterium stercoris]